MNADILKVDIAKLADERNGGKPIKVVANLPYYITTPIIMGLFESHVPIDSITIMVQKEVADRMQEGPGSKEYGALSLAVQYYAKPEIVVNVPPSCFMPQPKVGSAVIRLTRHENPPVDVDNEKLMFQVIRASFNQRRNTCQRTQQFRKFFFGKRRDSKEHRGAWRTGKYSWRGTLSGTVCKAEQYYQCKNET